MDGGSNSAERAKPGCMAVVVGPSGAGKDTLLAYAAPFFAGREDVVFARRVITRDPSAGGEEHDSVCEAEFDKLEATGKFAVSWRAHGLRYGIPEETRASVNAGALVVANGSRSALASFKQAYASLVVINVTARPEVLATRLDARGRESREDILRRLQRGSLGVAGDYRVISIDNSSDLETAGKAMVDALETCLGNSDPGAKMNRFTL